MIDELASTWDEVAPLLTPETRERILGLVVVLTDEKDGDRQLVATEKIRELLVRGLPDGHPLVASGHRFTSAPQHPLSLAALAVLRAQARAPWSPVDRILSSAWETAHALRARGVDPDLPDLIRLDQPDGNVAVPMFQFDADERPRREVLAVNEVLHAHADPWGVADWWLSRNVWLHDAPVDLLDDPAEARLLAAAHAAAGGAR